MPDIILLGLGFTTRRLAKRFLARKCSVLAAVRNADRFGDLSALGLRVGNFEPEDFPKNSILIHTIPPLPAAENEAIRVFIRRLEPRRVVYISSTGVYGSESTVDETTQANPSEEKGRRRVEEETSLQAGPWQTLIVRPAAIYGPGRGVHLRVKENRLPRAEMGGVTSRIHADDLAAVLEAGALSEVTGAWPLADDRPCSTAEVAQWCGKIFCKEVHDQWQEGVSSSGRRVDGRKIRELLEVELAYPEYQAGILACIAAERPFYKPEFA